MLLDSIINTRNVLRECFPKHLTRLQKMQIKSQLETRRKNLKPYKHLVLHCIE